jgi:mannosyltransferase
MATRSSLTLASEDQYPRAVTGTAFTSPSAAFADRSRRRVVWALAPLAVGLGTLALGTIMAGRRSLSTDEAAALAQADRPLGDVLHAAVHDDPGQAGYLLLLKLVARAGTGEATVRLASAVAVALAAALLVLLGTRLLGHLGGVAAGVALGANAGVVDVAREARPYALGILGIVASTLALVSALQRGGSWRWLGYGLLAVALPLTHPLAASALLVHGAVVTCHDHPSFRRRRLALVAAVPVGATATALLAWMAADQIESTGGTGTLDPTTLGHGVLHALGWSPLFVAATVAGAVALIGGRTLAPALWKPVLVIGLTVAPAVVCLLAATAMPVHSVSSLTLSAPGIALASGAALDLLPDWEAPWVALTTLAAVALVATVVLAARLTTVPTEDWRSLAKAVVHVQGARETIVVVPDRSRAALAYYAPELRTTAHARGDGAWVAVVADNPADAIARARAGVRTPTYALLRQFRYGDSLRLQHWVRP